LLGEAPKFCHVCRLFFAQGSQALDARNGSNSVSSQYSMASVSREVLTHPSVSPPILLNMAIEFVGIGAVFDHYHDLPDADDLQLDDFYV
jgi:hypothetical protein